MKEKPMPMVLMHQKKKAMTIELSLDKKTISHIKKRTSSYMVSQFLKKALGSLKKKAPIIIMNKEPTRAFFLTRKDTAIKNICIIFVIRYNYVEGSYKLTD